MRVSKDYIDSSNNNEDFCQLFEFVQEFLVSIQLKLIWEEKNTAKPRLAAPRATEAPLEGRRSGMASSLGKRIKTLGTKDKGTKRKEKEQFYSNKFRTPAHERYFPTVEGRRLLMERKERLAYRVSIVGADSLQVSKVIADEIQSCARGLTSKEPLGHPSLITHLCEVASIDVSRPPLERPRKELDAAYFTHYCVVDEPSHPAPPP
ncbi:hypothetical protein LR48_Vigan10g071300 [Vigna angularis]|uniref:Uncharacterized protein n=1 Tax=Phaseolus angularis TaxID=3914 RepID=A0A0L9VID3_PHAAN|nr:hypothetical protein LR48_Vigan10g071300 [Vigna angularis]